MKRRLAGSGVDAISWRRASASSSGFGYRGASTRARGSWATATRNRGPARGRPRGSDTGLCRRRRSPTRSSSTRDCWRGRRLTRSSAACCSARGRRPAGGSATWRRGEALRSCAGDLRRSRLLGSQVVRPARHGLRLGGLECGQPAGVLRRLALLGDGRRLLGRGHLHVLGLLGGQQGRRPRQVRDTIGSAPYGSRCKK